MQSLRRTISDLTPLIVVALLFVVVIGFGLGRGLFVGEDKAVRTLESAGYTEVEVTDKAWFAVGLRGCDKSDTVRFTVEAVNPAGQPVEVYVCASLLNGGTIRNP